LTSISGRFEQRRLDLQTPSRRRAAQPCDLVPADAVNLRHRHVDTFEHFRDMPHRAVACVGGLADRAGYAIVIRRWIWLRDDGRLGGAEQILYISAHIRRRFA